MNEVLIVLCPGLHQREVYPVAIRGILVPARRSIILITTREKDVSTYEMSIEGDLLSLNHCEGSLHDEWAQSHC